MSKVSFEKKIREVNQSGIQAVLENAFKELVEDDLFKAIYLFSEEGLPLALYSKDGTLNPSQSTELSTLMHKLVHLFDKKNISNAREIVVENEDAEKLVFRFFTFFSTAVALIVQVPAKKSYRGLVNRLEKLVHKLEKS